MNFDFFLSRKLITRELQEWHKQQVSKYKSLPVVTSSSTPSPLVTVETENEPEIEAVEEHLLPATTSPCSIPIEQTPETMIISALLPAPLANEDSRTLCSSSFIITDEPIENSRFVMRFTFSHVFNKEILWILEFMNLHL